MQPDAAALLWDARRAAGRISTFIEDRTWMDSRSDALVRSAVERQFQIIGEALGTLARVDPETASTLEDLPRIIAFRSVLVHGYAVIDDALVWEAAAERVPDLTRRLDDLPAGAAR
jgi:uncharacterized protein with HEPN domain